MPDSALLDIAAAFGFGAFLTCDQSLSKQQHIAPRPFGVVVVCTNNWPTILGNLDEIVRTLDQIEAGRCVEILQGAHRTRYGRKPPGICVTHSLAFAGARFVRDGGTGMRSCGLQW